MPIIRVLKDNVNQGELGPFLLGREDSAFYEAGALKVENWMLLPHGGIIRRPGFQNIDNLGPLVIPPPPPPPFPPHLCDYFTPGGDILADSLVGFGSILSNGVNPSHTSELDDIARLPRWLDVSSPATLINETGAVTCTEAGAVPSLGHHTISIASDTYGSAYLSIEFGITVVNDIIFPLGFLDNAPQYGVVALPKGIEFGGSIDIYNLNGNGGVGLTATTTFNDGRRYGGGIQLGGFSFGDENTYMFTGMTATADEYGAIFIDALPLGQFYRASFQVKIDDDGIPHVCTFLQRSTDGAWLRYNGAFNTGLWQPTPDAAFKGPALLSDPDNRTFDFAVSVRDPLTGIPFRTFIPSQVFFTLGCTDGLVPGGITVGPPHVGPPIIVITAKNLKIYEL